MFYSLKIQEFNIKFSNQYGLFITNLIQFIDINAYVFFHAVEKIAFCPVKGASAVSMSIARVIRSSRLRIVHIYTQIADPNNLRAEI